jgi:hypothetical protein
MPPNLPADLAHHYVPATDNNIRDESFGLLTAARVNAEPDWQRQRGTFDDQATFGPRRPFACACGKYDGRQHANVICDRCGVKVTTPQARRSRCAHINLPEAIAHPFGGEHDRLATLPVLPAAFVEAPAGPTLLHAYDNILRSTGPAALSSAFRRLVDLLLPVLVTTHRWNLTDRLLVAHGMALKERAG